MSLAKRLKNSFTSSKKNECTKEIGVDRKSAKPKAINKSSKEVAEITFKRHKVTFKKLA